MLSTQKSKHLKLKLSFIVIGMIVALISAYGIMNAIAEYSTQIQLSNSDDPQNVVYAFLGALRKNDFDFAKKLVIPEQYEHIDKWMTASKHTAFDCPIDWSLGLKALVEPFASGGGGFDEIKNNMTTGDYLYSCNNNRAFISIKGVILKYNGTNWKITNWDRVCESHVKNNFREICYP